MSEIYEEYDVPTKCVNCNEIFIQKYEKTYSTYVGLSESTIDDLCLICRKTYKPKKLPEELKDKKRDKYSGLTKITIDELLDYRDIVKNQKFKIKNKKVKTRKKKRKPKKPLCDAIDILDLIVRWQNQFTDEIRKKEESDE